MSARLPSHYTRILRKLQEVFGKKQLDERECAPLYRGIVFQMSVSFLILGQRNHLLFGCIDGIFVERERAYSWSN
jgi:hypothetical protein